MKMAHFVAMCVVCLFCATHTPCLAHMKMSQMVQKTTPPSKEYSTDSSDDSEHFLDNRIKNEVSEWSKKIYNRTDNLLHKVPHNSIEKSNSDSVELDLEHIKKLQEPRRQELLERLGQNDLQAMNAKSAKNAKNSRAKRSTEFNEKYFTMKLFQQYGNGEHMTMEGFEKLLKKIGLFQLESRVSEQESHSINSNQSGSRLDVTMLHKIAANIKESHVRKGVDDQRCLNNRELLSSLSGDKVYTNGSSTKELPSWLFERVCPALIYQLVEQTTSGCIQVDDITVINHGNVGTAMESSNDRTRNMFQVWVYSTVSILIISLCGLLGVAVIPMMSKSYYHQLLQFLVALAVGTLCGDALIHLLPHAMMSHHSHSHDNSHTHLSVSHSQDEHNTNMWKGFVAMIGLVIFFFTEKVLNIISEWRRYNQSRSKVPNRARVIRESDAGNSNTVGEKLCKHKYSTSYPYCYGEIATETQDNLHQHNHHEKPQSIDEEKPLTCNATNCNSVSNKIMSNDMEKKGNEDWKLDDTVINDTKKAVDGSDIPLNEAESYTVIIREHEGKHHGHSHGHSHVHSTPDSMSSVAWMVVMGDGLHNFTDGMAIGAAFSANIAGGFSTTIAVFCHELPHELGDFAVLLKAGMSAKQAIFYNLLSSILCLFGMVFGVLLGATPAASSWMFAAAAGMFIYIALVDMIPELSSNHSILDGAHWQILLQAGGLITGFGIMLVIALYEPDLQTLFDS
ncbi:zinc transporter foi isoform X2 [Phymastichus coffea]|uniref:zinc transporter foi isoform X2 n=1 Tax=Phymastichus coffea TaxID=108790 RepID=UPI00273C8A59|nr:zinc transporter foi isoform X2 [Phymastichus coffea]